MTEGDLTVAALNSRLNSMERWDSRRLLVFLEELSPDAEDLAQVDIDRLAAAVNPRELGQADFSRLLAALNRLRAGGAAVDISRIGPQTFAALMAKVSKAQLADVFGTPELRVVILDEIFRRMGSHLRAERAAGVHAVIRWRFTGGSGEAGLDRYQTVIADGTCTVSEETAGQPRVTITVHPTDFIPLIIGKASPPVLFMTGKLRIKGDLAFAAGLMSMFDLPRA